MPSTMRDSLESALAAGLGARLAAWDIVTFSADQTYDLDALRPAFYGPDEPPNAPDERVLLTVRTPIPVPDTRKTVDVPVGFNWRGTAGGDPLEGGRFLGLLKRRLHRFGPAMFGEIPVAIVRFQNGGTIGRDSRRRLGATATYHFRCREATANLPTATPPGVWDEFDEDEILDGGAA